MHRAISADGTVIAYDHIGTGPPLVLVGGGLADRSEHAPLASALAGSFTVVNYDRRGRVMVRSSPSATTTRGG
jgi:pimeloyl-ACP methyl ester carboxylesterase